MTQRTALLNGTNKNQDYDVAKILKSVATQGVGEGLEVQTGLITKGFAFINVTRDLETFPILFSLNEDLIFDTTGTKKIFIEIDQTKIDDGSSNSPDGIGIGEIKENTSYPATNSYISLAEIITGTITDTRVLLKFNTDTLNNTDLTALTGDIETTGEIRVPDIPASGKSAVNVNYLNNNVGDIETSDYNVGENITQDDLVGNGNLLLKRFGISVNAELYYNNTYYDRGFRFKVNGNITVASIDIELDKVGSPTQVFELEIYSDDTFSTLVATSTNSADSSTFTPAQLFSFTFTDLDLTNNYYYFKTNLVSGAVSTSNYPTLRQINDSSYSDGNAYALNNLGVVSSTSATTVYELEIVLNGLYVFKADTGAFAVSGNVLGIATETKTTGTVKIKHGGIHDLAGLDGTSDYYLSDTVKGGVTNSTSSGIKIGKAFSENKLLLTL